MIHKILSFTILGTAVLMSGCGLKKKESKSKQGPVDLEEAEQVLVEDLNNLDEVSAKFTIDPKDSALLGFESSTTSLRAWIDQRINYILPDLDLDDYGQRVSDSSTTTMAANLGTLIFLQQPNSQFHINANIILPINTPRVGLMAIGPGLFDATNSPNRYNPRHIANSFFRVITLAHEARHSDGRGSHLGFTHTKCPSTHDLAGEAACESYLNGPYAVGAAVGTALANACEAKGLCSSAELKKLRLRAADSLSRIIDSKVVDPSPVAPYTPSFAEPFRQFRR